MLHPRMTSLACVFTCNWSKDLDNDGIELSEHHGIKRSFDEEEQVMIVFSYGTGAGGIWELKVYNMANGAVAYERSGILQKGNYVQNVIVVTSNRMPPGSYMYNVNVISASPSERRSAKMWKERGFPKVETSRSEKFEILAEEKE